MRRAALIVVLLALTACGGSDSKVDVMPKDELHSDMWALAQLTSDLDLLMREAKPGEIPQARVVELLAAMERTAKRLSEPSNRKKHPLMEANIRTFHREATMARAAAASDPPNYYYAGALAGACIYCHDPEGGIR